MTVEIAPKRSAHRFVLDAVTLMFLFFGLVIASMFVVRLGMALFSSDKIDSCVLRSNVKGYTLVQQRRWEVIPMAVDFEKLDEMLKAALAVCPNLQAKEPSGLQ
jgi:hypothetical protein